MLILAQNIGESIYIFDKNGREIVKVVYFGKGNQTSQIKIGFLADKDITILREKVLEKELKGNVRKPDEPIFFMEEDQENLL